MPWHGVGGVGGGRTGFLHHRKIVGKCECRRTFVCQVVLSFCISFIACNCWLLGCRGGVGGFLCGVYDGLFALVFSGMWGYVGRRLGRWLYGVACKTINAFMILTT